MTAIKHGRGSDRGSDGELAAAVAHPSKLRVKERAEAGESRCEMETSSRRYVAAAWPTTTETSSTWPRLAGGSGRSASKRRHAAAVRLKRCQWPSHSVALSRSRTSTVTNGSDGGAQ